MTKFSIPHFMVLAGLAGLAAPAGPVHAQNPAAAQSASLTRELALATFDSAWGRINTTHYDTAFAGVDWTAVRLELRPIAAMATSMDELRDVVREMLARLGESHYTLIPSELVDVVSPGVAGDDGGEAGGLGMDLTLVEGRLAVWRVDPEGPAGRAGVRPGWIVESIGEFQPDDAIDRIAGLADEAQRRRALTQFLYGARGQVEGPAGSRVKVSFIDGHDRNLTLDLGRRPRAGQVVRFGALPPFVAHIEHDRLPDGDSCLGVIRFNVWMAPLSPAIDQAVDALRDCRGIILDLRGNPGGVAGMVMGVAGHFIDENLTLGTMKRRGNELNFVVNPRRVDTQSRPVKPYAGPLAILIDAMSVSTSEIFAGGIQAIGRARLFGETSAGQALPAGLFRLPDGDVLMHVLADFTAAGGTRIEGSGVEPDEHVAPDRVSLLAGHDPILDAAVHWIRSRPISIPE